MAFKVIISKTAQREIENVFEYYNEINASLPIKFYTALNACYTHLESNPYFQKKYKDFRAFPLKKFPFLIFFHIDEEKKTIKVLSCFHTAKNIKKYPK